MKISTTLLRNNVMVRVAFTSNVRKHINTGVKIIDPAEFINGVVVNHPDTMDLNAQIGAKVAEVKRAIDLLEAQGVEVTPDTLSNTLDQPLTSHVASHRISSFSLKDSNLQKLNL